MLWYVLPQTTCPTYTNVCIARSAPAPLFTRPAQEKEKGFFCIAGSGGFLQASRTTPFVTKPNQPCNVERREGKIIVTFALVKMWIHTRVGFSFVCRNICAAIPVLRFHCGHEHTNGLFLLCRWWQRQADDGARREEAQWQRWRRRQGEWDKGGNVRQNVWHSGSGLVNRRWESTHAFNQSTLLSIDQTSISAVEKFVFELLFKAAQQIPRFPPQVPSKLPRWQISEEKLCRTGKIACFFFVESQYRTRFDFSSERTPPVGINKKQCVCEWVVWFYRVTRRRKANFGNFEKKAKKRTSWFWNFVKRASRLWFGFAFLTRRLWFLQDGCPMCVCAWMYVGRWFSGQVKILMGCVACDNGDFSCFLLLFLLIHIVRDCCVGLFFGNIAFFGNDVGEPGR